MGSQLTLRDAISTSDEKGYLRDQSYHTVKEEFNSLSIPTPDNPVFDVQSWLTWISSASGPECKKLRANYSRNTDEYGILSAMMVYRQCSSDLSVTEAISIEVKGDVKNNLEERVLSLIRNTIEVYPLSVLLSSWIDTVFITDKDSHVELCGSDSSGFYHPTEHWVSVCYDSGEMDRSHWSRSSSGESNIYERSTTIHELGHAIHYLCGLQTEHKTVDNSQSSPADAEIILHNKPTVPWKCRFVLECISGYGLLLGGTYDSVDWNSYSKTTVEEFVAEGFNVYITSPEYLRRTQPLLYKLFADFDIK